MSIGATSVIGRLRRSKRGILPECVFAGKYLQIAFSSFLLAEPDIIRHICDYQQYQRTSG